MELAVHITGTLGLILYIVGTVSILLTEWNGSGKLDSVIAKSILLGLAMHTASLISLFIFEGMKVSGPGGDYLSFLSWALILSYVVIGERLRLSALRLYIVPLSTGLLLCSAIILHIPSERPIPSESFVFLSIHLFPALFADLSVILCSIISVVFLIKEGNIKSKSPALVGGGSLSLEGLEWLNARLSLLGFSASTLVIVSGAVWALAQNQGIFGGDPRKWASLLLWIVLGLIVLLREGVKISPRKISSITLVLSSVFFIVFAFTIIQSGNVLHAFQ